MSCQLQEYILIILDCFTHLSAIEHYKGCNNSVASWKLLQNIIRTFPCVASHASIWAVQANKGICNNFLNKDHIFILIPNFPDKKNELERTPKWLLPWRNSVLTCFMTLVQSCCSLNVNISLLTIWRLHVNVNAGMFNSMLTLSIIPLLSFFCILKTVQCLHEQRSLAPL